MANKTVEVIIRAKDLTASVVSQFRRRFRSIERTVKDVARAMVAFGATVTAAVFGLQKLTERGEEVIAVKTAFARITGDETRALNLLRQASRGAIDDFKLMALANQAMTLGAAKNVEQFAEMVEISRALGRAQGVDALSALESFTIGLARQSPRILDNIGLQIELGDTTTFAARAMEQARRKADELTGGIDSAGSAATRLAAGVKNAHARLAEWAAESPEIAEFLTTLADTIEGVVDAITEQDWALLADIMQTVGEMIADAFVFGINKGLQKLPTGAEWMENIPILRKWAEFERAMQDRFFGSGAEEGRQNFRTSAKTLEELLVRARQGAGRGDTSTDVSVSDPPASDALARILAMPITGTPLVPTQRLTHAAEARARARRGMLNERGVFEPIVDPSKLALTTGLDDAANKFEHAGQVAVASMSSAAAAIISGSGQIEASLVNMVTNVIRALPGVGGLAGSIIGGIGGIFGALLGRKNRDPVPVRLAEVDQAAADRLNKSGEPIRITTIIEQGGQEIERIERELADRQNRDETVRFNRGRAVR